MTNKDYNIDNYSENELFELFSIDSNDTDVENLEKIDEFMKNLIHKKKDKSMHDFLQNAGSKILSGYLLRASSYSIRDLMSLFQKKNQIIHLENIKQYASYVIDAKEGYVKLYLEKVFQILTEKISQKEFEIAREHENEFIEQFVYLDTRFRNNLSQSANNSIFAIPETKQVVSMSLHNIDVPLTWKIFDDNKQNNFFYVGTKQVQQKLCDFKHSPTKHYEGYTKVSFVDEDLNTLDGSTLNNVVVNLLNNKTSNTITFVYDTKSNKLQIMSTTEEMHIVFHDSFSDTFSKVNMNHTLGWKLGFRQSEFTITTNPTRAEAHIYMYPNSLYLHIDDFITNSSEAPIILPLPKYNTTNNDLTYCLQKYIQTKNINDDNIEEITKFIKANKHLHHESDVLQKHIQSSFKSTLKTSDIKLLLDEIQNSIQNKNIQRIKNAFAVIDLRGSPVDSIQQGKYISEYHEDFEYKKSYSGPSSISKIKISIYDEQGDLVDFQGSDFKLQLKLVKHSQSKFASLHKIIDSDL